MTTDGRRAARFSYDGWSLDAATGRLRCGYSLDDRSFTETFDLAPGDSPAVRAAARLVFLLAGISYYKAGAPPVIDLVDTAVTDVERAFLRSYYVDGLGEYAYKNSLDLTGLEIVGPQRRADPVATDADTERPLVPFGGGIDSIVVVESVRESHPDLALFIASRAGDRFAAIEAAAAVTGLPIRRADREIDPQILRSDELGLLNGHVPVTGILSSLAVVSALLDGRGAVIMSNEWSASSGTMEVDGRAVNHQWSKSLAFEQGFRDVLAQSLDGMAYFSALRPYSELWVARRMAELTDYHQVFRSCNRAFPLDASKRLAQWCGECDKCCFIDLILAPFLGRQELEDVFGGKEPLARPDLEDRFRSLLGDPELTKPFECVGDAGECGQAVLLAALRPDRRDTPLLHLLAAWLREAGPFQQPLGRSFIPETYAHSDRLV